MFLSLFSPIRLSAEPALLEEPLTAGSAEGRPGLVMMIPTDRQHPDRGYAGAMMLDLGEVDSEKIDLELDQAAEVMPDPSRPVNVAVYMAEDLPVAEQRALLESTAAKFRKKFATVKVLPRYVPRKKLELPEDTGSEESGAPEVASSLVVAEIPVAKSETPNSETAGGEPLSGAEGLLLKAGSVQASLTTVKAVGFVKGAISLVYWARQPGLGAFRLLLMATEPATEIGYTLNQRRFSRWLRKHNILFYRQFEAMSSYLRKQNFPLAGLPAGIARYYKNAEIAKSWLYNILIFYVARPGWGKLVNHWADPTKPSPFSWQFISEIGVAGALGILFYALGDKGFENLRRAGYATGPAHRDFLAATSFLSLLSLLFYTANPDPLHNWPLLAALVMEWGSYVAVYTASKFVSPINNRFVVVDGRLFEGQQAETTKVVLDELENWNEAVRAKDGQSRERLIANAEAQPKLRRFTDEKSLADRCPYWLKRTLGFR